MTPWAVSSCGYTFYKCFMQVHFWIFLLRWNCLVIELSVWLAIEETSRTFPKWVPLYLFTCSIQVFCQSIPSLTFDNVSSCGLQDSLWLSGEDLVPDLVFKSSTVQPIFAQFWRGRDAGSCLDTKLWQSQAGAESLETPWRVLHWNGHGRTRVRAPHSACSRDLYSGQGRFSTVP